MIEIQFIPLKTPDGELMGHARVQDGFVDIRMRGAFDGQALVLTDDGYALGAANTRIRTGGRVTAVAVHTDGRLGCVGFTPGEKLTVRDVRRRIDALTATPAPQPKREMRAAPAAAPQKEHAPVQPPLTLPVDPGARAFQQTPPKRRSARHVPADAEVRKALTHLAEPDDAAFFAPEPPKAADRPRVLPLTEPDDEHAEAFAALLERADAVFRRISAPFGDEEAAAPLAFEPRRETRAPERTPAIPYAAPASPEAETAFTGGTAASAAPLDAPAPASEGLREAAAVRQAEPNERPEGAPPASQDGSAWSRAVDDMLKCAPDAPAPAPDAAASLIENPFPHIFPGARFHHRGELYGSETLMGEWERSGEAFHVTAVLGAYSPQPPDALPGFTRYIRTLRGGYWVRVEDGSFLS